MTPALLSAATGCTAERAALYAQPLAAACERFGITTPQRMVLRRLRRLRRLPMSPHRAQWRSRR